MVERKRSASLTPGAGPELALLKGFESAMREGLLLDEAIGGILAASLRLFDAAAVGLLPAGGAPPLLRTAAEARSGATARLTEHMQAVLEKGTQSKSVDEELAVFATPVKALEQVNGAFGIAFDASSMKPDSEEAVRVLARIVSHVLERERTFAKLIKRREESVALFELASGALHSLSADEVIRMTVVSLARELDFDRVVAYRFHAETREIEEILSQGAAKGSAEPEGRRALDSEPILVRCLSAHGPAFEDAEAPPSATQTIRKRLALPIQAGDAVFGFLTMTRRGVFVLTPQEMRLAQELAKLAAGALEKARLIDAERRSTQGIAFVARLHAALGGLTEVEAVLQRTVEEVGPHLDLDLCAVRLSPSAELPGAAAAYAKTGARPASGEEIPDALLAHLSAEGSHVLLPDVSADAHGLSLIPAPSVVKNLARPISLLAVPLAYRGAIVGVLTGVVGGRPKSFTTATLRAFEAIGVELSLAVTSARLIQKERDSNRFLDRLREVGRTLTTTFDTARIKQILCEQAVALLAADAAQFWDADEKGARVTVTSRWGAEVGGEIGRSLAIEESGNPAARAYFERTLVVTGEDGVAELYAKSSGPPVVQAAALAIVFQDELLGLLTVARRRGSDSWTPDFGRRLALLADAGAVSLHNARMMKIIERDSERDGLTGLYTRAALLRRLETEIRRAERSGLPISVAHARVDGFTDILQKVGSELADALLPKISAQLVRATRAVNLIGRDRGDRFFILIFDANKSQAQRAAESIQKAFSGPGATDARLETAGVKLSLTMGIAAYPEDAFDTPSLVLRAEEALDEAVKMGAGKVVLYGAFFGADESELTM
jgi:diguanylate cyclase (GGDEF)-like protein